MNWGESVSLLDIIYWPIKVLSFSFGSSMIILAEHNLEIIDELTLDDFSHESFRWLWINRLPPLPIIFCFFIKEAMVSYTVWRSFVNIFYLISVLMRSTTLIKKFLILCMVMRIIFTVCDRGSIIPWRYLFRPRQINPRV